MHELSIATAVIDTTLKHADGRKVSSVSVRAVRLRQVVPESLRFYFEIVARDTPCEGAALELIESRRASSSRGNGWPAAASAADTAHASTPPIRKNQAPWLAACQLVPVPTTSTRRPANRSAADSTGR